MNTEQYAFLAELVSHEIVNLSRAIGHDKSLTDEGRDAYKARIRVAHECLCKLNAEAMQREVRRVA